MTEFCHRCSGELPASPGNSSFCPHCGAPQLYFASQEPSDAAAIDTTGALPPPRPHPIEWKTAIRCASLVGVIAAVLSLTSTRLSPLSSLWTISLWAMSASLIAMGLYQRRRPQVRVDAKIGGRIGLVVGLLLVTCLAVSTAVAGIVSRYSLHNMASFDAQMAQMTQQFQAQVEHTAATNDLPKADFAYIYTPEFKIWAMLLGFTMIGGIILVLSSLGGAVGGMLRAKRSHV